MFRFFIISLLFLFSLLSCPGQPYEAKKTVKVKDLVETIAPGEQYCTSAIFDSILDYQDVMFSIEDESYIIPVRLLKNDLGAEKRLRALNLSPGDTLTILGKLSYISIKYESYKGLMDATILNVRRIPRTIEGLVGPDKSASNPTIQFVQQKPSFNGGDANEFSKWVNAHLNYPKIAKENGVRGRVIVAFTVKKDGSVSNVRVIHGVDESLDQEAVRVISSSPKWKPGRNRGEPVDVTYTFPVIFALD